MLFEAYHYESKQKCQSNDALYCEKSSKADRLKSKSGKIK